jgi:hypothetical protein
MAAPRLVPSATMLQRLVERGLTHQQIADEIHKETGIPIARSTVSAALSRAGLTERVRYDEVIPWDHIKIEHNYHYALTMLRIEARLQAGLHVSSDAVKRLNSWKEKLLEEDAVVVYRKNSPDGFYYVKRKKSDGDSLVRV